MRDFPSTARTPAALVPYQPDYWPEPIAQPMLFDGSREYIPKAGQTPAVAIAGLDPALNVETLKRLGGQFSAFTYSLTGLSLASGATLSQQTININTDAYFVVEELVYVTSLTAANPLATSALWRRASNSEDLFDRSTPVRGNFTIHYAINGNVVDRNPLWAPVVFIPGDSAIFALTDAGSGVTQTPLAIQMRGYKCKLPTQIRFS